MCSSANNIKVENNDVKIELANENLDKGKSILGAHPKLEKKDAKNPKAKKANFQKAKQKKQLKRLNRRSSISVIIVVLPVILDLIAISG